MFNTSRLSISGGLIRGDLRGSDSSTIEMSGGTVLGRAIFDDNSVFNYSGGFILDGVQLPQAAGVQADSALADSLAPGFDENLLLGIVAHDNATINIIGTGLHATLIDPSFEGMFSVYQLAGRLADGTEVNGGLLYLQNGSGARLELLPVPEPGMLAILALTTPIGLFRRRRLIFNTPKAEGPDHTLSA
jgi:hypothetical protein